MRPWAWWSLTHRPSCSLQPASVDVVQQSAIERRVGAVISKPGYKKAWWN